jgi:Uma2 family endonuclease
MILVMPTANALLTFEEFARLPEEPGKMELLDGVVIKMPPAERRHNQLSKRLFLRLFALVESLNARGMATALGEVEIEMGYRIASNPDSWLTPDVSIAHRDQPGEDYYEGAPLIAIEVISESNTAAEIDRKIAKYLAHGAREVWVAYQETRRVLTYFAGRDEVEIGPAHIRSQVLPEVSAIPLSEIWEG